MDKPGATDGSPDLLEVEKYRGVPPNIVGHNAAKPKKREGRTKTDPKEDLTNDDPGRSDLPAAVEVDREDRTIDALMDGVPQGMEGERHGGGQLPNPTEVMEWQQKKARALARLYRKVDVTQEYAENNYYKLPIQQQIAGLIPVSRFWLDYSRHTGNGPFLSPSLPEASRNFTEMMFALSVLDLPFTPAKHDIQFAGTRDDSRSRQYRSGLS